MLVSIVMDPRCLAPEAMESEGALFGAETLLEGVMENGVLLAADSKAYVRSLASASGDLSSRTGQRLQVLVAEILKAPQRFVAEDRTTSLRKVPREKTSGLGQVAKMLRADVVVCRSAEDVQTLSGLADRGIEVCTMMDYRCSATEALRKQWFQTTRLDDLVPARRQNVIGRALKYATEIVVVDRYVGVAAKEGRSNARLQRFARGLVYVAECWRKHSPYAEASKGSVPTLHLVSIAGTMGAAGGYVNHALADPAIRAAVQRADRYGSVGKLQLSLKVDSQPPIANDRFIAGMSRCFGVHHGLDDLGKLGFAEDKRRPTSLSPDCQHHRELLAAIRRLDDAQ